MMLDAQNQFSDAQALAATGVSTNVIDLGVDREIGIGEPMCVLITVDVAADTASGDETYTFQLQSGSTATPTTIVATLGFGGTNEPARTTLAAGYKVILPIPPINTLNRFLRMNYVLGGTTPSITVTAELQPLSMVASGDTITYPDNITIS